MFYADELRDYPRAMRRWWKTHALVWPALDVLASQYRDGNSYSPARLISVFTALEAYARARHGHEDLKRLRTYARLPSSFTGATNPALDTMGACRGYFAHLNPPKRKYTVERLEDSILPSTRLATVMVQACLLRELGFRKTEARELLERHYHGWPLT